jgi:hypothetical protein
VSTSKTGASSTGPTFPVTQNNRSIVKFGREAPAGQREAAGAVLEENLKAREAANFKRQCKTLSLEATKEVAGQQSKNPAARCPPALRQLAEPLSSSKGARKNTLNGPIAELRIEGGKGYALYHGNDGDDYSMLMKKEGAVWKVGSVLTEEL